YDKNRKSAPMDELINSITFPTSPDPISILNPQEMLNRVKISTNLLKERHDFSTRYRVNLVNNQLTQLKKTTSEQNKKYQQKITETQEKNQQLEKQLTDTKQKLQLTINKNHELTNKIRHYQGTLNRKSVKTTLKVANSLANLKKKVSRS
ncbi:TPA: pyruvyl-transferase, partial [Listeria monocytogenes]|nr:pyruvyl-transferase [Listeria monocytogenes]